MADLSLLDLNEGRAQKTSKNSGSDRTLDVFFVDLENRREVSNAYSVRKVLELCWVVAQLVLSK
jgi:hypothetical protein